MKTATTERKVYCYVTGKSIGTVEMTDSQWDRYMATAQQPEGLIQSSDLASDSYGNVLWSDAPTKAITVYLD